MAYTYSLKRRLVLGLTLSITVLWLIAVAVSGLVVQHKLNEVLDSALEETAQRILPLAVIEIMNRETSMPQRVVSLEAHDEHLTYLVRNQSGDILLRSHNADINVFGNHLHKGFITSPTHRIYGATAIQDSFWIQVSEPLAHRREATFAALILLLLPLILLIPLSLISIWWLIHTSLYSIRKYCDAITAKRMGDLSPIQAEQLPVEIEPINIAVNQLMERLRRTLDVERNFTANSAHELRTPLATALAKTQRLKQEVPPGFLQEKTLQIEQTLQGLSRLSEKLMQLAKAEGGRLLSEQPQDLLPVLTLVVDEFHYTTKIPFQLELPNCMVLSTLDLDAFAILVRNLIDNALKHGAKDQPVTINFMAEGVLRVINSGPVISSKTLKQLCGRFVRATTDTPGSGLGLAIADAIASGTGAALTFHSPATGQADGFEAIFDFQHIVNANINHLTQPVRTL